MTTIPTNLQPLLDGDILRYEVGFAAEAGWRHKTESEDLPPWDFVEAVLHLRLEDIKSACHTDKDPIIYYTTGRTFRYDIAKRAPYKGTRKENKPWHYDNLTVYMRDVLGATEVTGIEADDRLAIDHCSSLNTTILCSRDKDLKQVPGWFYSWELGKQPSFGPELIDKAGYLKLSTDRKKLTGTGLSFFYAQVLMGDGADNIPGLPGCGPVAAFELLQEKTPEQQLVAVCEAYSIHYDAYHMSEELLEQGRLCWLTRRLNEDGSPQLWEIGIIE